MVKQLQRKLRKVPGISGRVTGKRLDIQPWLFVLPAITLTFVFHYLPLTGLQIAFKDFIAPLGIWGSPWIGLEHFERFLFGPNFGRVIVNTISVSFGTLVVSWPWPIIFALSLNELRNQRLKGFIQTVSYAPHFVSVVVVVGMVFLFTSPSTGVINTFIEALGGDAVNFMVEPGWFLPIYIISENWQHLGWGSIIYLAVLSQIDPTLYEAATIDGASRLQKIRHVNLPHLVPIIVIQLILQSGRILQVGFEKVYLMQTPLNQAASEVISTYVYRTGILQAQFAFATAVGLFRAVISLVLIVVVNRIARKVSDTSLW